VAKGVTLPARQMVYPAPIPADCEQVAVLFTGWNVTPIQDGRHDHLPALALDRALLGDHHPLHPGDPRQGPEPGPEARRTEPDGRGGQDRQRRLRGLLEAMNRLGEVGSDVSLVANPPSGGYQTVELNVLPDLRRELPLMPWLRHVVVEIDDAALKVQGLGRAGRLLDRAPGQGDRLPAADLRQQEAPARWRPGCTTSGQVVRGIQFDAGSDVDYTLFVDQGTKPHVIKAKNAPYLVFFWPKVGRVVHFKSVHHPGNKAYGFLEMKGLERALGMWERGRLTH
jgi:hypothetical protein